MEVVLATSNGYHLSALDIAIVIISFVAIVPIAIYSARRTKNTDDYFLADRSVAGWVIGLSIIGTSVSSLAFLAFPAAAYKGNWIGLVPFLVIPFVAVIADQVCLPIYRKTGITSGYEYLERRFGPFARLYGSMMFLLLQIARVGLILVLMSLPLKLVTGMSQTNSILLCGAFTTIYVFFGGFSAVLWADVFHTIVLALGGLFCVGLILYEVPGGLPTVLEVGWQADKFSLPSLHAASESFGSDFVQLTLVVLVLYGVFDKLLYYCADQNIIQRYLAASSSREARKALWIGTLGVVPVIGFFTFLGTCLYVYYAKVPDPAVGALRPDEVFPHFILSRVPPGIVGIIVSGLLAAAVSSLDSNLNAIAMVFQIDIYQRHLVKNRTSAHYLRVAKITTLIVGAISTLGALALIAIPAETVLELMFLVYAIFGGGLAGLVLIGMLSRRATTAGTTIGIIASLAVSIYLVFSYFGWLIPESLRSPTHPYLIAAIGNTTLLVVGYIASLIFRRGRRASDFDNLTVWHT